MKYSLLVKVETSFLNFLQLTTNFCPSEIKCKERHLQQIDYFLYSFLPLLPSVGNTHLCYVNIQYAYCILYSSSVAIWTYLTNKIKFLGNTNIQYAFCLCYDQISCNLSQTRFTFIVIIFIYIALIYVCHSVQLAHFNFVQSNFYLSLICID